MVLSACIPLALVGTGFGLPLGCLGAVALNRLTGQALQAPLGSSSGLGLALLVGAIVGPVLTLLAALWPAQRAASISPLESLRQAQGSPPASSHSWVLRIGLLLTGSAAAVLIACLAGRLPPGCFVPTLLVGLAVSMMLVPAWLKPLSTAASWLLRPLFGYETSLARRQVSCPGARNALAAGILFMATAAGVAVNNTSLNLVRDIGEWYQKGYPVKYILRAMMPDMRGAVTPEMPQELADRVEKINGVTRVERIGVLNVNAGDIPVRLLTRELALYPEMPLSLQSGDRSDVGRGLREGEVLLGGPVAQQMGLAPGDTVELGYGTQTSRFRIVGVVTEYLFGGQIVMIDREVAQRIFGVQRIDALMIETTSESVPAVGRELQTLADECGLLLHTFSQLGQVITTITGEFRGGVWLLLAISFVLCGFGIVNTLTMNVLEQGRELGLLRLVGLECSGLQRLVVLQSVLLSASGILPGVAVGLGLAWLINQASGRLFGNPIPFEMHLPAALACGGLAFALALISACPPALRASRLDPLEAVRRG